MLDGDDILDDVEFTYDAKGGVILTTTRRRYTTLWNHQVEESV